MCEILILGFVTIFLTLLQVVWITTRLQRLNTDADTGSVASAAAAPTAHRETSEGVFFCLVSKNNVSNWCILVELRSQEAVRGVQERHCMRQCSEEGWRPCRDADSGHFLSTCPTSNPNKTPGQFRSQSAALSGPAAAAFIDGTDSHHRRRCYVTMTLHARLSWPCLQCA